MDAGAAARSPTSSRVWTLVIVGGLSRYRGPVPNIDAPFDCGPRPGDHGKDEALLLAGLAPRAQSQDRCDGDQARQEDGDGERRVSPIAPNADVSTSPRLMACPIDPPFVHDVWSLDFKYARYAKKLGDCAGAYGSAAPGWVTGSVNSEPKPVRLGPGADHRLPPIVVYNNINLK